MINLSLSQNNILILRRMNKRLLHFVILGVILNEKDSNHLMLNLFRDWISLFKERNLTKPKVGLEGEVRTCGQSRCYEMGGL